MSFLDNLESTLKNLEGANEKDTGKDRARRNEEKARALAVAPHAELLKTGPFVNEFLTHAVRIGHASRTKINMLWLGNVLRVDAKERRLEFRPEAHGVEALFFEDGEEIRRETLDLTTASPEKVASAWLED